MTDIDDTFVADDVRITDLRAAQHVQSRNRWNRTMVKVETDTDLAGYGEVGANGDTVRGQLHQMENLLVGENPLEVERLYDRMMTQQHSHRPHVPTVSGVDIALWDLAGKILNKPVSELIGGRFRESVPLYVNTRPDDPLDPESCREWADRLASEPDGTSTFKVSFDHVIDAQAPERGDQSGRDKQTLKGSELKKVERAVENVREALGWEVDFIFHCHNEWDLPSALGLAEAIAPAKPLWLEDPLPIEYSDTWRTLHEKAPCRILTGEKLEGVREFEPFITNGAVDVVQPDLVFAGGITGCRKIAAFADRHYVPITAHNTGGLLQNAATIHFAASTRNFWMTETRLPRTEWIRNMGDVPGLEVENGRFHVPEGPGLGVTLDDEAIEDLLIEGETYWD